MVTTTWPLTLEEAGEQQRFVAEQLVLFGLGWIKVPVQGPPPRPPTFDEVEFWYLTNPPFGW